MKVCILGNGLTSLTVAKILVNMGINVDIFSNFNFEKIDKSRTLSISKKNMVFFNSNVSNVNQLSWKISKIEIYSENLKNEKVLNFENNQNELFSIIKNYQLKNQLKKELNNNKFLTFKKVLKIKEKELFENYNLVVNTDPNNYFKKIFL